MDYDGLLRATRGLPMDVKAKVIYRDENGRLGVDKEMIQALKTKLPGQLAIRKTARDAAPQSNPLQMNTTSMVASGDLFGRAHDLQGTYVDRGPMVGTGPLGGTGFWDKLGKHTAAAVGRVGLGSANEMMAYGNRRANRELDKLEGGKKRDWWQQTKDLTKKAGKNVQMVGDEANLDTGGVEHSR